MDVQKKMSILLKKKTRSPLCQTLVQGIPTNEKKKGKDNGGICTINLGRGKLSTRKSGSFAEKHTKKERPEDIAIGYGIQIGRRKKGGLTQ